MTDEERKDALSHAASFKGFCLIRMADGSFALARHERNGATLDEIEAYWAAEGSRKAEYRWEQGRRLVTEIYKDEFEWFRRRAQENANMKRLPNGATSGSEKGAASRSSELLLDTRRVGDSS